MSRRKLHGRIRAHEHARERQHQRGAAHVLLHEDHAARGFDVEAAGVEADALAHERDQRRALLSPAHVDEPRLARAALAHLIDEWIVLPQQVLADDDPAFGFMLQRETLNRFAQFSGTQVVRGRIDEVARLASASLASRTYSRSVPAGATSDGTSAADFR